MLLMNLLLGTRHLLRRLAELTNDIDSASRFSLSASRVSLSASRLLCVLLVCLIPLVEVIVLAESPGVETNPFADSSASDEQMLSGDE
jgi:hypothetical protein